LIWKYWRIFVYFNLSKKLTVQSMTSLPKLFPSKVDWNHHDISTLLLFWLLSDWQQLELVIVVFLKAYSGNEKPWRSSSSPVCPALQSEIQLTSQFCLYPYVFWHLIQQMGLVLCYRALPDQFGIQLTLSQSFPIIMSCLTINSKNIYIKI
jgi:hypothetical protein